MEEPKQIELNKSGRTAIGGRRPPDHVVNKNVDLVHRMINEGWQPHQIYNYFPDKPPTTVQNWIQAAHKYNKQLYSRDREYRIIEAAAKLDHLYTVCLKAKEYSTALNALKTKIEMFGDKGAIKVEHHLMPEVPTRIVLKVDKDVK